MAKYHQKSFQFESSIILICVGEKLKWFKDNIDMEKAAYTKEEAYDLIEK